MVTTTPHGDRTALRRFDLNLAPVAGPGIVSFGRAGKQIEVVSMCRENFADAADQVTVGSKRPARKMALELLYYLVEALNKHRNVFGGGVHSIRPRCVFAT